MCVLMNSDSNVLIDIIVHGNGWYLNFQESEDARNIINRKKREFSEDEQEQMRSLGGSCSRCRGNHRVWHCPKNKQELTCTYPPCFYKQGHSIGACHDLLKRCRLDICKDQRGHRATCHSYMPDKKPYGFGADAVEALKQVFEDHRYLLTSEESSRIAKYEKKQEEERNEKEVEPSPFREHPDFDVMEILDDSDRTPGGGLAKRGRAPRPSPYGDKSWIFGGFQK